MPHDFPLLNDLLILLVTSIPIAFISSRLRLPTIVGFMITGIIIGPYGLGLIKEVEAVEALAEIGVVLLLFAIGLEFSLRRILEMKRLVFGAGGLAGIADLSFRDGGLLSAWPPVGRGHLFRIPARAFKHRDCLEDLYGPRRA